jgi:phage internal scaffolding protein
MKFRTPYTERVRVAIDCSEPVITKQAYKDECDVNNIIKRWARTGLMEHVARYQGSYVDLPDEIDYKASMDALLDAQEAFASLPSKVRQRFENDPVQFLQFVHEPGNEEEMRALGLLPNQSINTPTAQIGEDSATPNREP